MVTQKNTSILTKDELSEAGEVLAGLRARDIRLMPDGDQLRYDAPAGAVPPAVVTLLREHKVALLALLSQPMPAVDPVQPTAPTLPEPLTPHYPCVVCGNTDRWDDRGIWRCGRCWPPGSLGKQATPHTVADYMNLTAG
jgi:hypothetical protein